MSNLWLQIPEGPGFSQVKRAVQDLALRMGQGTSGKGAKGDKGEPGPPGTPGAPGTDGQSVTSVTVTTGAEGTDATAAYNSTTGALDLTIPRGNTGAPGVGVPTGGTAGQVLVKASPTDYDTIWSTLAGSVLAYQPPGSPLTVAQNDVVSVTNAVAAANHKTAFSVLEELIGATISNTGIDFSIRANYTEQDNTKTDFVSGVAQLKAGTGSVPTGYLSFNVAAASTNRVDLDTTLDVASALTIEVYCRPKFVTGSGYQTIVSKRASGSARYQLSLEATTGKLLYYNGSTISVGTYVPTNDTPVWLALTLDASGNLKFYANGVQQGSTLTGVTLGSNSAAPVAFGALPGSIGAGEGYRGFVYEVRIWNVARTATELANNLALKSLTGTETGLIGYYKFTDASGSTLTASKGPNGTITGATWGSESLTATVYPSGTGYYVSTAAASSLSLATVQTINSVTVTYSQPTNTSIKCLVSFDGRTTWKYYDGSAWQTATGGLAAIETVGCTIAQMQSGLTSKTITTETALDFAFSLKTTDQTVTPYVDLVTVNYTEKSTWQTASVGKAGSSADYTIKRTDANTTLFKKQSTGTVRAYLNVFVSTT